MCCKETACVQQAMHHTLAHTRVRTHATQPHTHTHTHTTHITHTRHTHQTHTRPAHTRMLCISYVISQLLQSSIFCSLPIFRHRHTDTQQQLKTRLPFFSFFFLVLLYVLRNRMFSWGTGAQDVFTSTITQLTELSLEQ